MGWFRRRDEDIIDLTMLEKKGLIKRSREVASGGQSSGEVLDFTSGSSTSTQSSSGYGSSSSSSTESSGASSLGFLSNLANVGASSSSSTTSSTSGSSDSSNYGSYSDKLKDARKSKIVEFNSMKFKLEDTEYKLDRAIERIQKLEEKFRTLRR